MKIRKHVLTAIVAFSASLSTHVWANLPYFPIQFPRDDAAHDNNTPYEYNRMTEWWYYNGKITTPEGRHFGYYVSYFYMKFNIMGMPIKIPQYTLQITDIDNQKVYGKSQIFAENQTTLSATLLDITYDKDITLHKAMDGSYELNGTITSRQGPKLAYSLRLTPTRDALLINKTGQADMWDNTNTYYYSYTHMNTAGFIKIGEEKFTVDSQRSLSWMDHQWGDFMISPLNHWMWDSIQLDNGIDINLSVLMDAKKQHKTLLANIIMPDGTRIYTSNIHVRPHVKPGGGYPQVVEVSIPEINLHAMLKSYARDQDMGGLFEGIGNVEAIYQGAPVNGFAYMETTVKY